MRNKVFLPLTVFAATVFAALSLFGAARSARADTIITVCDEANLNAALAAGGVITFDCNNVNDSATINFTASKSVALPTKIDGGGRITLQGGNFNASMIYVDPGASLRMQGIALKGNTTTGLSGGAFYNNGSLELAQVDITGMNVGGGFGGAIYSAGPLTLTRSALVFNYAGYGGAIRAGGGSVSLENSTIAFNYASAFAPAAGDGIYIDAGVPLTAVNATIAYNGYNLSSANIVVDGGALTLRNTLLQNSGYANITRTTGSVTSLGYNLADDSSGFLGAAGDINGADALLMSMVSGSPEQAAYLPLDARSPAIDAADPANPPPVDTANTARPQNARADIGAVEVIPTCFARVQSSGLTFTGTLAAEVQRAVDAAAEGDVVKVAGYCPHWQMRSGIRQAVIITHNLTLRGGYTPTAWALSDPLANPTTIDPYYDPSSDPARALFITATTAVTVENITLLDGGRGDYDFNGLGGNIYHGGAELLVSNTLLLHGFATFGAGLFNDHGSARVVASQFSDGYVITSGGAIFNEGGVLNLDAARVLTNGAGYTGGGVYNNNGGAMTITASAINANFTTAYSCGGLCNQLNSTTFISGTEIAYNAVPGNHGGGIDLGSGTMMIIGSRIHDNRAQIYGAGILSWYGTTLIIEDSDVDHNTGDLAYNSQGGGLTAFGAELSLNRVRVISNTARSAGGLMLAAEIQTISDSVVAENYAPGLGGGAWLADGATALTRTTVASNTTDGSGGGIYIGSNLDPGALTMKSVTVTANSAAGVGGGGICLCLGTGPMRVDGDDVSINANQSRYYGAGVYAYGNYTLTLSEFQINDNATTGNSGGAGGAGLQLNGVTNGGVALLSDGDILRNESQSTGGGIDSRGVDLSLTRVRVEANRAYNAGGILSSSTARAASLIIDSSVISANVAITLGAGGIWNNGNASLMVTGTRIISNVSATSAGALYNSGSVTFTLATFTNSLILSNTAGASGAGAIFNNGTLRFANGVIAGNRALPDASSLGGAIWNQIGTLDVVDSLIERNVADAAAGIFNNSGGFVSLRGSIVRANTAMVGDGGGAYNANATLILTDTRIAQNQARSGAGVLSNGAFTATAVTIEDNIATGNVGGAQAAGSVMITSSIVRRNQAGSAAGNFAGGLLLLNANALVANTVISGNSAGFAGGIYVYNTTGRIYDSAVYANTASQQAGGGINLDTSYLTISRTAIYSNSATGPVFPYGGGIYIQNAGAITLSNVTLSSNLAGYGGGIVMNGSNSGWITATTIARNIGISGTPSILFSGAVLRVANSIVGLGLGNGNECSGFPTDNGYNIETSNSCNFSSPTSLVNQFGLSLDSLRANGGSNASNWTHGLPPGNVAIDRIPAANCIVATDQRGTIRPQPIGTGRCDVGAFESDAPDLGLVKSASALDALPGQRITYTLSFSNSSPIVTATGAVITDILPPQLTGVSVAASMAVTQTGSGTLVFGLPPLAPGAGGVITLSGVVNALAAGDFLVVNSAMIGGVGDVTSINNASATTTTVTVPRARFSASTSSAWEGSGVAVLTITLTATNPYSGTPVGYQTFDGSASASSDYTATAGIAIVPAGQTAITITIGLIDDGVAEGPETFIAQLSGQPGSALGAPALASVTINDGNPLTPRAYMPLLLR